LLIVLFVLTSWPLEAKQRGYRRNFTIALHGRMWSIKTGGVGMLYWESKVIREGNELAISTVKLTDI